MNRAFNYKFARNMAYSDWIHVSAVPGTSYDRFPSKNTTDSLLSLRALLRPILSSKMNLQATKNFW